jgi:hypothetical protein
MPRLPRQVLAVRVDRELIDALSVAAIDLGIGRSELVRRALTSAVDPELVEARRQEHLAAAIRDGLQRYVRDRRRVLGGVCDA